MIASVSTGRAGQPLRLDLEKPAHVLGRLGRGAQLPATRRPRAARCRRRLRGGSPCRASSAASGDLLAIDAGGLEELIDRQRLGRRRRARSRPRGARASLRHALPCDDLLERRLDLGRVDVRRVDLVELGVAWRRRGDRRDLLPRRAKAPLLLLDVLTFELLGGGTRPSAPSDDSASPALADQDLFAPLRPETRAAASACTSRAAPGT